MTTGEHVWNLEVARPSGDTVGAWAFRHRSWLPIVPALALLIAPPLTLTWIAVALGALLVAAGQALRFWAVRHIGVISRTRSRRLGPLITTGPYGFIRNPLYVGNALLWTGFVLSSRVFWMLPIAWAIFTLQYGAMARWEERVLTAHHPGYATYVSTVGGWIPRWPRRTRNRGSRHGSKHGWSLVLFSERGTLAAELAMGVLLIVKNWMM
jgi:protein-S-isoprenylcysteine O-methyltransferase Ste14